jgi:hypothetical protein
MNSSSKGVPVRGESGSKVPEGLIPEGKPAFKKLLILIFQQLKKKRDREKKIRQVQLL